MKAFLQFMKLVFPFQMEALSLYFACILNVVKAHVARQRLPTNIRKDVENLFNPNV